VGAVPAPAKEQAMNSFIKKLDSLIEKLASSRVFKSDFDYHLVRRSMVFVFLMFGYQKWFEYEAETLIPFIKNGPLIFWMYPVFGIRGAS
jgi:uncharacterized membrane protein YkgB